MKRRQFIQSALGSAALLPLSSLKLPVSGQSEIIIVKGESPAQLARRGVEALGGMNKFVSRGDVVVLKPNMSWDRVPAQAANTNPDVVGEVVRMCTEAGAKKVKVFDNTLNEPRRCYKRSGIETAAKEAGADVFHVHERRFKMTKFPEGELIKAWEIYKDVLEADKIINVPCAKHHSAPGAHVSLGMKNLMGFIGGVRGKFHRQFEVNITDLNQRIRPVLTILDAYRLLLRNGPSGGSLADVSTPKTLIAGADPVAVDSYGATLFGLDPEKLGFLRCAHSRGLGQMHLNEIKQTVISLS